MPLSICTTCLSRLRLSKPPPTLTVLRATLPSTNTSFHSSAPVYGDPSAKKKKATGKDAYRILHQAGYQNRKRVVPKTPPIGERQMQRKRIVLSNANAAEIRNMPDLSPGNMGLDVYIGKMMGIDGGTIDKLRAVRAFAKSQNWKLFSRPATLMRRETCLLGKEIDRVGNEKKVIREVVTGPRGSGKSIYLLQAMSMAFMKGWIVINVPDAQEFVINHSAYSPIPKADGEDGPQQYIQPHLTADLLNRLSTANQEVLQSLELNHPLPKSLSHLLIQNLHDLASAGAKTPALAARAWEHFLSEVKSPGQHARPPVLFALDGLDHWMGPTKYRASDYKLIHAHQFKIIIQLLSLLFTSTNLPNGGMVLGATTGSNNPVYPSFTTLIKQISALSEGMEMTDPSFPLPTPYSNADTRVLSLLSPSPSQPPNTSQTLTQITHLSGLSKPESVGLLSYFISSGILKANLTEPYVGEAWTLASGGVVGELCKFGSKLRLDPEKTLTNFGTMEGVRRGGVEHKSHGRR